MKNMTRNAIFIAIVVSICLILELRGVPPFITFAIAGLAGILGFYLKIIKLDI